MHNPVRRRFTQQLGTLPALAMLGGLRPLASMAQSYPDRPIKIIVPAPTGTYYDIYSRRVAPYLSTLLGQPILVENKPGAGGNIAMEQLTRAPADGYSLAYATPTELGLLRQLGQPYVDTPALLTPLALLTDGAVVILCNSSLNVKTLAELLQYLSQQRKPLDMAIGPLYSASHVLGDMISKSLRHRFNLVPYKAIDAALPDLASGAVPISFAAVSAAIAYIQSGKAVPIGYMAPWRSPLLPNVATVREQGHADIEYVMSTYFVAHRDVPEPIQRRLHQAFNTISALPDVMERTTSVGGRYRELSFEEVKTDQRKDQEIWNRRAIESGIKYVPA
jgi:tripartite-type tricarboxylate transporter receptor subunit TctC